MSTFADAADTLKRYILWLEGKYHAKRLTVFATETTERTSMYILKLSGIPF